MKLEKRFLASRTSPCGLFTAGKRRFYNNYFFVDDGFQVSVPAKQLNGHIIFVAQCVSRKYKFLSCIKTVFFCFFDYACKIVLVVVQ